MLSIEAEAEPEPEETQNPHNLLPKRSGTSLLWHYFGFDPTDLQQKRVLCKSCRGTVKTSRGNTTNLRQHLYKHHRHLFDQFVIKAGEKQTTSNKEAQSSKQTQITLKQSFESVTPYETSSRRHRQITESVTYHLAKDSAPINTVTKAGFKKMVRTLDRRYALPSRTYFSQVGIPEMYTECKKEVELELSNVDYYSATTDLWSSRTTEPYLSLTVHFIDNDFVLKTRCLQTMFFPDDHTGENIAAGLKESLAAWGLKEENLTCFTTDNGSNVIKALETELEWTRLQCFGHRLHLAIENAVRNENSVKRVTGVCKAMVGSFSHSWKKRRDLGHAQKDLRLKEHSLIRECPTRWGSRQRMMERILEQEKALSEVLSKDKKTRHLVLTWQDKDVLEAVNTALQPLKMFTDALSGELYVSVSYLKPVLHLMRTKFLAEEPGDTTLTKQIKSKVLAYMEDKYSDPDCQELLDIATFLDPRYKFDYMSIPALGTTKARVKREMEEVAEKESARETSVRTATATALTAVTQRPAEAAASSTGGKRKKSLGSFLKSARVGPGPGPASSAVQLQDAIVAELNSYMTTTKLDEDEDPLSWWKDRKVHFPMLSQLARKYLCIPATSSPSERLFSTAGNVVTCDRACLKPAKVDMLVFLAKNLRVDDE